MTLFKGKYRIESARLPDYDYAGSGKYFITVCTRHRIPCFGEIVDREMRLSPMGEIVARFWMDIVYCFPDTYLDEFQIMPDHVHGIIVMDRSVTNTVIVQDMDELDDNLLSQK